MHTLIAIAKTRWLAKTELHEILSNASPSSGAFHLNASAQQIHLPPSGSLILYDRDVLRRFRKDGALNDWVVFVGCD